MMNLNKLAYEKLHWCCGRPEQVLRAIHEVLKQSKHNHTIADRGGFYSNCYEDGYKQFMWHALNDAGLLEHGSGVGGSWLTDEGEYLLKLLEEKGVTEVSEMMEEYIDD